MTWNYRVMTMNNGATYTIHEVYYDEEGKPRSYTVDPIDPCGESLKDLKTELSWMRKALSKPILTPDDFDVKECSKADKSKCDICDSCK